jgi:mono/diheme cytochrome c family protein
MKLSYFFLALALAVFAVVSIAGFRGQHSTKPPFEIFPDMNYQDKVKDQQPSAFFADGNSARPPVPGTVAEEMPAQNDYWSTGKWDDNHWGDGFPVHDAVDGGRPLQIDEANMARGRERYTISCEPCHGAAGDGKGITSQYGLNGAANYHTDRLRQETDGQLFDTITNGKGQMFGYNYNITIDDRWRIVMYIRALQRSQNAALDDASPDEQAQLQKTAKPAVPAAPATTPAPAKPAGSAMNGTYRTNGTYATAAAPESYSSHTSYKSHPPKADIVYLSQQTMKGWVDQLSPYLPNETGSIESPTK